MSPRLAVAPSSAPEFGHHKLQIEIAWRFWVQSERSPNHTVAVNFRRWPRAAHPFLVTDSMAKLRKMLIEELEQIPGIDVHLWRPDRDFMVIDYKGKEVAHFHGNNELDVRLSPEVVKRDGLTHAPNRVGHPSRKNGGTWLIVRFTRERHLTEMVRLVKMAVELR